ncbi:MAG: Gfo/Idh/MocA family protein [Alphaproteobacteria bacterium]
MNAAIVGLGRWGQTLVASVQDKSDRLRFTTAVTRDPARSRDFLDRHGLQPVRTLDPVLADPGIDAVVLATPHSQHADQIVAVAGAGKAVFCEKPLTLTRAEAERAVAACRETGVVLGVGTDKRFFPAMQELARIVASGELGRLLHIEANFSNEVSATLFSPWRDAPDESPAGGMTGTRIHALDAMIRMAGPVRRVQAQLLTHRAAPDPLDTLVALLEFRSGVSGMLAAVRCTPLFWRVHAFGRDGSAEALGRTELVLRRSGEKPQLVALQEADSVRANLEAFADAVADTAPYPIGTDEMVAVVAAFEAIALATASDGRIREV